MTPTAQDHHGLPGHHHPQGHGSGTDADCQAEILEFDAEVLAVAAVDSSTRLLRRLRERAHGRAVADLDATWPELGEPDQVWPSASLRHMTDPDRVLRQVRAVLVPGGLFTIPPRSGAALPLRERASPRRAPAAPGGEDRTALDQLLDTNGPHSILRRDDLAVRTERTVWAARRS